MVVVKQRTIKKQIRRLNCATATLYVSSVGAYFVPARKPITGKSARRLLGWHYGKAEWVFCERPKFNEKRKYIFLDENLGLTVHRAELNRMYRQGWQD